MDTQAVDVYSGSLSELNSLSKVEINALTMMADDNKEFAVQIAACIENHLKTAIGENKLPILYLIDSICKNYPKSSYVQLFTQNIVSNFCNVFEVSKEKTRRLLYKLRITWEKAKTFPQKKLNAIDQRVHEMDPNWPILANIQAPNPVPVDSKPKTQAQQKTIGIENNKQSAGATEPSNASSNTINKNNNNNNTRNKQPKTRGSKKAKTAANNGSCNIAMMNIQGAAVPTANIATNGLPIQMQAPQALHPVPQTMIQPDQHTISPFYTQILPTHAQQLAPIPPFQQPPSPNPYPTMAPYGYPTPDGLYPDMTSLLPPPTQLPLSQPTPPVTQQVSSQHQQQHTNPSPLFSDLDMMTLNSLYGGKQCSNCSLRFDDNNKYAIHLDWHFRQNLKSDNVFARRKWYYPLNLWVQFREINDDDVKENIGSDNNNANDLLILHQNDNEVPTAPASKEDEKNICSVCHETFEKFWAEEEEEWRLRNARLHEDDQRVYHPLCLNDMLQANAAQ